jgi:uncharacterized lipoprotein YddW (UPF0748 family)
MAKTRPDLALHLGSKGYVWLDPAHSDTQAHSLAVVMDVVDRYDVDGIHFDDYFYPYPDYNDGRDFPDDESWSAYRAAGGDLPRDDWRRHSVDTFVRKVHEGIRSRSPHVKFGISPFGIWRPGHPAGIEGFDAYDVLAHLSDPSKLPRPSWLVGLAKREGPAPVAGALHGKGRSRRLAGP